MTKGARAKRESGQVRKRKRLSGKKINTYDDMYIFKIDIITFHY